MNSAEQKNHRTVTKELAQGLATVASATATELDGLRKAISEERTHRLKLAEEQRAYVDARDRELRACCQERWDSQTVTSRLTTERHYELRNRGFWSRLNWLVTGR